MELEGPGAKSQLREPRQFGKNWGLRERANLQGRVSSCSQWRDIPRGEDKNE
jgi:hypothetical protein